MEIITPTKDGRLEFLFHRNRPADDWEVTSGEVIDVRMRHDRLEVDISVDLDKSHSRYDQKHDRMLVEVVGADGPVFEEWVPFKGRSTVDVTVGLKR